MRIHKLQPPTANGVYKCSSVSDDLDVDYDLKRLGSTIAEVWYWYTTGSYEGAGWILTRNEDGLYTLHCASHCSCYGPCDHFSDKDATTLDELLKKHLAY